MHHPRAQPRRAVKTQHPAVPFQHELRTCHADEEKDVIEVRFVLHGKKQEPVVEQHHRHHPQIEGEEQVSGHVSFMMPWALRTLTGRVTGLPDCTPRCQLWPRIRHGQTDCWVVAQGMSLARTEHLFSFQFLAVACDQHHERIDGSRPHMEIISRPHVLQQIQSQPIPLPLIHEGRNVVGLDLHSIGLAQVGQWRVCITPFELQTLQALAEEGRNIVFVARARGQHQDGQTEDAPTRP